MNVIDVNSANKEINSIYCKFKPVLQLKAKGN